MTINHIAMWVKDLETVKQFYKIFFNANPSEKYVNKQTGFSSYFLKFDSGCALEIMFKESIPENKAKELQQTGLAHFAIAVGSKETVDEKTEELRKAGFTIFSEPRWTGDGYYESGVLDPENNSIEITI